MKSASALTALALLSLAMPVAADCGSHDASTSASTTPPSRLVATPVPAAAKASTSTALKAPASKVAAKQVADKSKEAAPETKVAAISIK